MDARDIIETLGGRDAVAEATGADPNTVLYWMRRQRIPVERWDALLQVAGTIPGCPVTLDVLHKHLPRHNGKAA